MSRLLTTNIGFGARYRYTERLINEHDPLYILGHFSTDSTGKRSLSIKKMTGNILRLWQQDFAGLLEKYDSSGDGELDIAEWKSVQQAAKKEALQQQRKNSRQAKKHAIAKPTTTGLPFLIGSQEQDALSSRYRFRAMAYSLAFLLASSAATWYISARFTSGL